MSGPRLHLHKKVRMKSSASVLAIVIASLVVASCGDGSSDTISDRLGRALRIEAPNRPSKRQLEHCLRTPVELARSSMSVSQLVTATALAGGSSQWEHVNDDWILRLQIPNALTERTADVALQISFQEGANPECATDPIGIALITGSAENGVEHGPQETGMLLLGLMVTTADYRKSLGSESTPFTPAPAPLAEAQSLAPSRPTASAPAPPAPVARPAQSAAPVASAPEAAQVAAAPNPPAPSSPPEIQLPDWQRRPSPEDMERFYPEAAAQAQTGGKAVLSCIVTERGLLAACAVISESPAGLGFGDAALRASRLFRMKPAMRDGQPVSGASVRIPIAFDPQPG